MRYSTPKVSPDSPLILLYLFGVAIMQGPLHVGVRERVHPPYIFETMSVANWQGMPGGDRTLSLPCLFSWWVP